MKRAPLEFPPWLCFGQVDQPSATAQDVVGILQYLFSVRGTSRHLRSDNGPEFVAKTVRRWLARSDVKTLFIAKGSPWKTATSSRRAVSYVTNC